MRVYTFLACCATFLTALGADPINLPSPSGPHNVRITSKKLVDESRVDPFDAENGKRALMVTSFVPADCASTEYFPYMPDKVAREHDVQFKALGIRTGTFERLRMRACSASMYPAAPAKRASGSYPLAIFSPGANLSRLLYNDVLANIASQGYVVVSVDHPHDSSVVEYPDGEAVYSKQLATNPATRQQDLETRVADLRFVLDHLQSTASSPSTEPPLIPSSIVSNVDLANPAAIGHSFGGATAAQAILEDARFRGGCNLDGIMFGSVVQQGIPEPFLLMKSTTSSPWRDSTWNKFITNSPGKKVEVQLLGSKHDGLTDMPIILDALPYDRDLAGRQASKSTVGTVSGSTTRDVLTAYVEAAVDWAVGGTRPALLEGPAEDFPMVKYIRG